MHFNLSILGISLVCAAVFCAPFIISYLAGKDLGDFFRHFAAWHRSRSPRPPDARDVPALSLLSVLAIGAGLRLALTDIMIISNGFAVIMGYPAALADAIAWSMVVAAFVAGLLLHYGLKNHGTARWAWITVGLLVASYNGAGQGYVAYRRAVVMDQWAQEEEQATTNLGGSFRLAGRPVAPLQPDSTSSPAPTTESANPWAMAAIPFSLALIQALALGLGLHCLFLIVNLWAEQRATDQSAAGASTNATGSQTESVGAEGDADDTSHFAEAMKSLIQALAAVGAPLYKLFRLPFIPVFWFGAVMDGILRGLRAFFRHLFPTSEERVAMVAAKQAEIVWREKMERLKTILAEVKKHEKELGDCLAGNEKRVVNKVGEGLADLIAQLFTDLLSIARDGNEEELDRRARRIPRILKEILGECPPQIRSITDSMAQGMIKDVLEKWVAVCTVERRSARRRSQWAEEDRVCDLQEAIRAIIESDGSLVHAKEGADP